METTELNPEPKPLIFSKKNDKIQRQYINKCWDNHKIKIILFIIFIIIIGVVLVVVTLVIPKPTPGSTLNCMRGNKVIIASIDGMSIEYITNNDYNISVPNMDYYFVKNGVSTKYGLKPTFPTKTYSSHYSMVTGAYPAYHGIISNNFFDPVLNKSFNIRYNKEDTKGEWYFSEPIWNTIKLKDLNSAGLYFPGTLANCSARSNDIGGYPTFHYDKYEYGWTFQSQINKTIELLTSDDPVYDLVLLYYYQPDFWGHLYGPNSANVKQIVEKIDEEIGLLMNMLKMNNLDDSTDVIIVSDHGMTNVQPYNKNGTTTQIHIDSNIFDFNDVQYFIIDVNLVFIYLYDYQNVSEYVDLLNNAVISNKDKYRITINGNNEYHFNYGYNNRIPNIMMESLLGYTFYTNINGIEYGNTALGNHGYNNSYSQMHGIFYAHGPSFKSNHTINNQINGIDMYPILCKLLCNVEPNPETNGTLSHDLLSIFQK